MLMTEMTMEGGLRRGFGDVLAAALRPVLEGRDGTIPDKIHNFKTAFSSWDNCMQAGFCKWPVIAVMIVGGLIIFSMMWCVARCACCGLSCCCEFFHCLKCCGECCGCCSTPDKRSKDLVEAFAPAGSGYKSQAPMLASTAPFARSTGYSTPDVTLYSKPTVHEPPQYAEFDVGKGAPEHEDALPAMPSWEHAESKKVLMEEEVELSELKKPGTTGQTAPLQGQGAASPTTSSMPPPSQSPTGSQLSSATSGRYFARGTANGTSPYGQAAGRYNLNPAGHSGSSSAQVYNQAYGRAEAVRATGRRCWRPLNDADYSSDAGYVSSPNYGPSRQHSSHDSYDQDGQSTRDGYGQPVTQAYHQGYDPGFDQSYGMAARQSPQISRVGFPLDRMRSAALQADYGCDGPLQDVQSFSPAPQTYSPASRVVSPEPAGQYSLGSFRPSLVRPPPQRQHSDAVASSPWRVEATGQFDLHTAYTRPYEEIEAPDEYRQPSARRHAI